MTGGFYRYRLTIEYDGGPYHGWQRQPGLPSVQEHVEDAIRALTQERAETVAAGRTDAGVHAAGQVIHADLSREWKAHDLRQGLNFYLRREAISVLDVAPVPEGFHARFSARLRRYRYRILNRKAPPALDRGRVWHVPAGLSLEPMRESAALLAGQHDFTSFRASECQAKSPVKTLDKLTVTQMEDVICFDLEARSFLHHMVRNIVGTLALTGRGKWTPEDVAAALAAKDRARGGPTAPPHGLCLMEVVY